MWMPAQQHLRHGSGVPISSSENSGYRRWGTNSVAAHFVG
jgi:hypothetical protein